MLLDDLQLTFQLSSHLLTYPNKQFVDSFLSLKNEIDHLEFPEIKNNFNEFFNYADRMD